MGCGASVVSTRYKCIKDNYHSFADIQLALKRYGMDSSQLIVGIDFTKSNDDQGKFSFGGKPLHRVTPKQKNPYQEVLTIIASQLAEFDADQLFPCYGFGDTATGSGYCFSFNQYDKPCNGLPHVMSRYEEIAKTVSMSGPTSLAPLIRQAIKIVRETKEHNILLIIADGAVSPSEKVATEAAITEASWYALSIVMVGVGDGPWDIMERYDDDLKSRRFDNFQFVDYNTVFKQYPGDAKHLAFACHALMEVPAQFNAAKLLGYFNPTRELPRFVDPPMPLGPPDNPNPGDPGFGILPDWTPVYDRTQKSYFYMHKKTNQRVWGRPVDAKALINGCNEPPPAPDWGY
jgi:E3 ubiquitin-protein ligase RGLG